MTKVPSDLEKIIKDIIAYEEKMKKQREEELDESGLEYLYDYSDYPEKINISYDESDSEDWSTVIKINL